MMNYDTLEGTTSALDNLKTDLKSLEDACTLEILMLDNDKWSDVKVYIQDMIERVEKAIKEWPTGIGENMKSIETSCKEKS